MHFKQFILIIFAMLSIQSKAQLVGELNNNNRGTLRVLGSNKISQNCNLGDIVEAVFYFENNSSDTVYISQVAPDCQCTHFIFPEKGVKPHSTDSITLFFMSQNTPPGPYFKRTIVDYDDTSFELIIEGNIAIVRNVVRAGQKPILYQKKQIRVHNAEIPQNSSDKK
jgi:hypothetical protein